MRYFDYNASSPLLPQARESWLQANAEFFGNPSSPHRIGARADRALTEARERLAAFLGCEPQDVVWTSGATESNNLVMHHLAQTLNPPVEVWLSAIEHPCVLRASAGHFPQRHRLIPVTGTGVIDVGWLKENLARARPGLVAIMAANNETGVLQSWEEALKLCREREVPFFCDAAQWLGRLPARGLGQCDFVSGCAHKFGGPKGVGFLKCPSRGMLRPLMLGGQQEEGRRAGTENVPGALSMIAALEVRETALAKGEERQRLVVKLDKIGFAVSTGSACASGQEKPSHVLAAMGYGPAQASRVLRFSSGWETTQSDWRELAEGLVSVHNEMVGARTPRRQVTSGEQTNSETPFAAPSPLPKG